MAKNVLQYLRELQAKTNFTETSGIQDVEANNTFTRALLTHADALLQVAEVGQASSPWWHAHHDKRFIMPGCNACRLELALARLLDKTIDDAITEARQTNPNPNRFKHPDLAKTCPKCDSPAPHLHPAVQHEGEVQPCDHAFHKTDG